MRVAADDDSFSNTGKRGGDPLLRGDRGQDLLVAARRSVAEESLPEPVDVEGHVRGEIAEEPVLLRTQLVGDPGAGHAITVTAHPDGVVAEIADQRENLAWHRACHDISAYHDAIDGVRSGLREHRLESREVPVDVVQSGNPH